MSFFKTVIEKVTTMKPVQKFPIAQLFTAPQGEAMHSGVLMRFVRLAGCNVGKYSVGDTEELSALRVLNPKHSICTSALGDSFLCDTDYHGYTRMTAEEAIADDDVPDVTAICITGGEPFMFDLAPFIKAAKEVGRAIHIETSGTKPIPVSVSKDSWITCSPKEGFLQANLGHIDEFKFLIKADTPDSVLQQIYEITGGDTGPALAPCYLQPINGIDKIDMASVKRVLEIQRLDPRLVVSVQMHKVLQTL